MPISPRGDAQRLKSIGSGDMDRDEGGERVDRRRCSAACRHTPHHSAKPGAAWRRPPGDARLLQDVGRAGGESSPFIRLPEAGVQSDEVVERVVDELVEQAAEQRARVRPRGLYRQARGIGKLLHAEPRDFGLDS